MLKNNGLLIIKLFTALIMLAGGIGKITGVEATHVPFIEMSLPVSVAYFVGSCQILGAVALFIPSLSATAAAGLGVIMLGALYYRFSYTPIYQAIPALLITASCLFIFLKQSTKLKRA